MNARYFNWAAHSPGEDEVGDADDWSQLVATAKGYVATLFNRNPQDVSFHHNTTAAFQRIVVRLRLHFDGLSAVLLVTDHEYPGLIALLDEQWPGPIVMVSIADLVWCGKPNHIADRLELAARRYQPQVVLLSQVSRSSGLVIDRDCIDRIRLKVPKSVLIVDGAQAVGNVEHVEIGADFYVFSGHKWIGSLPTLGIVVAQQEQWNIDDPAQGYSVQKGSRGTGSEKVLNSFIRGMATVALNLSRHHSAAKRLAVGLAELGLNPLALAAAEAWAWNGIVTAPIEGLTWLRSAANDLKFECIESENFRSPELGSKAAGRRFVLHFSGEGIESPTLHEKQSFCDVPVPLPAFGVARFCVHPSQSSDEVEELLVELERRRR